MNQTCATIGIQQAAINRRAIDFVAGRNAIGPARTRRVTTESVGTAARATGFPQNLVVVEFEVKIACARVGAICNDELEAVELVSLAGVITYANPVDAKCSVAASAKGV